METALDNEITGGGFRESKNYDPDIKEKSLRKDIMDARKEKEKEKAKDGEGINELFKKSSALVMNSLWECTCSLVGLIPGFLALNLIAFFKITGINIFGVVDKIQFRLGDKMGLLALDLVVILIFFASMALIVMIVGFIDAGLADQILMVWSAIKSLGWGAVEPIKIIFKSAF